MFNNALQRSSYSKESNHYKYSVLPLFTSNKSSKKYHTPFKTTLTTMNTNNNTLSLYSIQSRIRSRSQQPSTNQQFNTHISNKNKKQKKQQLSKYSKKVKDNKKYNKKCKSLEKTNKQTINFGQKLVTNKQLYKGLRESVKSYSTNLILCKIGKIFDLILSNNEIPYQIHIFLHKPLQVLRKRLRTKGKVQIGHTLTQFKNNCMQVIKQSSSSQIALFQRMQLPSNLRWSCKYNQSIIKKEYQLQRRLNSFSHLKKKGNLIIDKQNQALNRIQNCLDNFLLKSAKYRKVYL